MRKRIPLEFCRVGDRGKIAELATFDRRMLGKLMSLGIVPGTTVQLLRKKPGIIVQAGYTKVALDRRLAGLIVLEIKG
jgi:Fe2+ transport system protein FeoA